MRTLISRGPFISQRFSVRVGMAALAVLALATAPARATDLWNQQSGLPAAFTSFPDQEFDDGIFDSFTTYLANDVEVTTPWNVSSISVVMTASQPAGFVTMTTARLNVFPNTTNASVPAVQNNPAQGTIVPITITANAAHTGTYLVVASGLNLNLGVGEYWIDLTPIGGVAAHGESLEAYSTVNAAGALRGTATINPGQGYQYPSGAAWDTLQHANSANTPFYAAIDIQGTAGPEPASLSLLAGGMLGLALRRRARVAG